MASDGDMVPIVDAARGWLEKGLGDHGSREIIALLLQQIESDRERITRLLARPTEDRSEALREEINDMLAAEAGGWMPTGPEVIDRLRALTNDGEGQPELWDEADECACAGFGVQPDCPKHGEG